jgi:hypothetical protein
LALFPKDRSSLVFQENAMRNLRLALAALLAVAVLAPQIYAQESPQPNSKPPSTTLKVLVVIAEVEGEKKVANLPYTFFLQASDSSPSSPWTKVRMGSRVPVATGSFQAGVGTDSSAGTATIAPLVNTQFQYIDVGTHIDARATTGEGGHFDLVLNLERSWVESDMLLPGEKQSANPKDSNSGIFRQPLIRQFKTELTLPMKDGQTIQSTQATDPLSGRVLTITVTMNVVK